MTTRAVDDGPISAALSRVHRRSSPSEMEVGGQLGDVVPRQDTKDNKGRFSLLKGLFVLGLGMFIGFFLAYELINTAGDVLHFDDVISLGLRKTPSVSRRDDEPAESTDVKPYPNMTSSTTSSDFGYNTSAVPSSIFNASLWEYNGTSDNNVTDVGSYVITNVTQAFGNISYIYNVTTTTTTTPTPPCFQNDYQLCNSCEITSYINATYGDDVTLENIGHMIFKVELIDRLLDKCHDGEWCLSDDWLLISDNNAYLDFCYASSCLQNNIPDDCLDKKRRLIVSTLVLLCDAVNATVNITDQCFLSLRKMAHVTMAKLNQEGEHWQNCSAENNCTDTCHEIARGLYCMDEICEHKPETYKQYAEWQWYFDADGVVCDVDNGTICSFLLSPAESWYDSVWRNLKKMHVTDMTDARVLSIAIVSAMILVTGVVASVLACTKKTPLLKRYSRDRVEYTPVSDDDDEVFDTA